MTKKQRLATAVERLKERYPDALCSLTSRSAFELLVATRLSAQCTDARVNLVTPALFARCPDAGALAETPVEEVEELIRTCGLYKTKARDLVAMAGVLVEKHGGRVPDTMEELTALPGIGRKTANLIMGDIYGAPAVVTDTHLIRLANRLELVDTKDPFKVEQAMWKIIDPAESNNFCHRAVLFGRDICTARSPRCGECPLADICPAGKDGGKNA